MGRSVHQGDPAAPYLYLLCGEVLLRKIKENSGIQGIDVNGLMELISQFTDDTQIFIKDTIDNLDAVIDTLTIVENNIGLVVNYNKSSVHLLGDSKAVHCTKPVKWDPGGPTVLGISAEDEFNVDASYQSSLNKIQNICEQWGNRNLNLMGKVLLVNSLMGSLFLYKMQVLKGPSKSICDRYDSLVERFLWKGKRPKIALYTLKKSTANGGLQLTDLKSRNQAIKISWIFKEDPFFQELLSRCIPATLGTKFLECQLKTSDEVLNCIAKDTSPFICDILISWFNFTWQNPDNFTVEDLYYQIIWFNSNIKIDNVFYYRPKLVGKGVLYVSDLLDTDNCLLSHVTFCNKYDVNINWLEYVSLCKAIPKRWIALLKASITPHEVKESLYDKLAGMNKTTRFMYTEIIDRKFSDSTTYMKFCKILYITKEEYSATFSRIFTLTNVTKYRDFQYRLLSGAIHANDRLFHWKKVLTQRCDWCHHEKQTTLHMLLECPTVQRIWIECKTFVTQFLLLSDMNTTWNVKTVILNNVHATDAHLVNFLILVIKQFIYRCKCQNSVPTFIDGLRVFDKIKSIELYNAKKNSYLSKHNCKWHCYIEMEDP